MTSHIFSGLCQYRFLDVGRRLQFTCCYTIYL
nr:MAG TPA: Protein of unknown function (DUF3549) [Bacteriophage sp.]DAT43944.1 MAG TPA: Protein of unknown function (DUF3549) [Caudoviricetes sp.]DAT50639.1 MAG TPA: Protein of unknown function (DUF3549) [Bacteriophage sp.]